MNKTNDKKSFPRKFPKKYPVIIGVVILGIIITHFAFQMNFIQTEQFHAVEVAVRTKNAEIKKPAAKVEKPVSQVINIYPEFYEVQKVKIITIPEKIEPAPRRQVEKVPALKTQPKKKTARKTDQTEMTEKEERLRRAEKILTGY